MITRLWKAWAVWLLGALALTGFLLSKLNSADARIFLPGQTTHGHYQIELQCSACHGENLDDPIDNAKCMVCHEEELKRVDDSHPIVKFKDPRNAELLKQLEPEILGHLNERFCITCHTEHVPQATGDMGLTLPEDYCAACHMDVYKDRPSHQGLPMNSCATAGCHNFHDNSALYEDLFVQHIDDPKHLPADQAHVPARDFAARFAAQHPERQPLTIQDAIADPSVDFNNPAVKKHIEDWSQTAHARAGINCLDCHTPAPAPGSGSGSGSGSNASLEAMGRSDSTNVGWVDSPTQQACMACHGDQVHQFQMSRHGMRTKQGYEPALSEMSPSMARLPMKPSSFDLTLNCNTCHGAHRYDSQFAAVDACMQCHNDTHTQNFKDSKHFALWQDEQAGLLDHGSGVSCATCHLPRETQRIGGKETVRVNHNQNDFLRPNEKMLRPVCMQCHGMGFAIDALADEALIKNNFQAAPAQPHFVPSSLDLVIEKINRRKNRQRAQ